MFPNGLAQESTDPGVGGEHDYELCVVLSTCLPGPCLVEEELPSGFIQSANTVPQHGFFLDQLGLSRKVGGALCLYVHDFGCNAGDAGDT